MEGKTETNRDAQELKGKIIVLPKVDKTLEREGYAADAKETGYRLKAVNDRVDNIGATTHTDYAIEKSSPAMRLVNTGTGREGEAHYSNSNNLILSNKLDDNNMVGIWLKPETENPQDYLDLGTYINGEFKRYPIFGTYNKPKGKYTGTGTATSHTVNIGGVGTTLKISTSAGMAIVTGAGAICKAGTGTDVYGLAASACKFDDGVLTLATTDGVVNGARDIYYEVL